MSSTDRIGPRMRSTPPGARQRLSRSVTAALVIGAVITAFPLIWMLSGSFKPLRESIGYPPTLLPHEPTLENYLRLFTELDFGRYFVNTVIVVLIGGVGMLLMAMAGYAFAKFDFTGKR